MTILKIDSSITGENSVSRALTGSDRRPARRPATRSAQVVERDLVAEPLAHLTLGGLRRHRRCSTNSLPPTRS